MNSLLVRKIYWQSAMIDLLKFRIASIPRFVVLFLSCRAASPSCEFVLSFAAFHFFKNRAGILGSRIQDPGSRIKDPGPN